jgi:cytochrome c-type biogenesis protein CcmF
LIWYGGLLMLLGGILCWWPDRRRVLSAKTAITSAAVRKQDEGVVV